MTLRGVIENGRIVLDDGTSIPDGTHVDITLRRSSKAKRSTRTGVDPLARIARRAVSTGIPDLANEHDHYAYGTPKRAKPRATRTRKRGGSK